MSKKTNVIIITLLAMGALLMGGVLAIAINPRYSEAAVTKPELERRLNMIGIGIQRDYIENLFGAPIYRADIDDMDITYYKLDGVTLRIDYDNDGAAAGYLITAMDERVWSIDGYGFFTNGGTLGGTVYSELKTAVVEANKGGNRLGQVYYAEYANASTYTGSNYLVQAYMPYGYDSGGISELIFIKDEPEKYLADYEPGMPLLENTEYNQKRGEYIPNSYGEFRARPTVFAFSEDAYRLLAK